MVIQTKKLLKLIDCEKNLQKHKSKADLLLKEIQQIKLELEQLQIQIQYFISDTKKSMSNDFQELVDKIHEIA